MLPLRKTPGAARRVDTQDVRTTRATLSRLVWGFCSFGDGWKLIQSNRAQLRAAPLRRF